MYGHRRPRPMRTGDVFSLHSDPSQGDCRWCSDQARLSFRHTWLAREVTREFERGVRRVKTAVQTIQAPTMPLIQGRVLGRREGKRAQRYRCETTQVQERNLAVCYKENNMSGAFLYFER
jgi:hypothetical protein